MSLPPPSARATALELTQSVLERRQPFDHALEDSRSLAALTGRDRGFARLLASTVLRRLGQIDAAVLRCLERPLTPKAGAVRHILRLGAAQLLFLRTPPHAAVDATVALAVGPAQSYRALVNAVLRRLAREGDVLLAELDAARLNLPDWLWTSWVAAYGADLARAIAGASMTEPPLDLTPAKDADAWAARLGAQRLPTGTLRLSDAGLVPALPGYAEGAWWVQDAAAALPARLFGDVRGQAVVDLCAAPGGKTAQLAALGAKVTAVDRSAPRLKRLRENLDRLRLDAAAVVADAEAWRPAEPAPFVLLDAPCSATGTLRRHPDIAWLKTQSDVDRLTPLQDRLLTAAVDMLTVGGTLVYCTCSLQPEEGPERIAALLAQDGPVVRRPIDAREIDGMAEFLTPDGDLRTLPNQWATLGGLDGFYAARLTRL